MLVGLKYVYCGWASTEANSEHGREEVKLLTKVRYRANWIKKISKGKKGWIGQLSGGRGWGPNERYAIT